MHTQVSYQKKSSLWILIFVGLLGFASNLAGDEGSNLNNAYHVKSELIRIPSAVVKISDSVKIPAEHAGVLVQLQIREGQLVQRNQLIGRVDDSQLRLRQAKARLENQIAQVAAENDVDIRFSEKSKEVAQSDVARSNRANARVPNSISASRLERQILERDRTTLQMEQAQRDFQVAKLKQQLSLNEVQLSQLLLDKTRVLSPMHGMVVSVEKHAGEWVEPSETIARIVRVDRLRVEGFVSAEVASRIRMGTPVEVVFAQDWLKGQIYPGRVVFVSPEANPVNSEVIVWVEIANPGNKLVAGLRGEIRIDPNASRTALNGQ